MEENNNAALTAAALKDTFARILLDYFFNIIKAVFNRSLPILMNTDGKLLQFSKSYFKLTVAPEDALNCLLPLTLEDDPDEFLQEAKKDKSGRIKQIEFPWLQKGNKQHKSGDHKVLWHITIEQGRLILETNSQERAQSGEKLLSQYLENAISFQQTLRETPEQKMTSFSGAKPKKDEDSQRLLESPEMQERLKAMAREHWESWFDESIPLLKNKTPREGGKNERWKRKA